MPKRQEVTAEGLRSRVTRVKKCSDWNTAKWNRTGGQEHQQNLKDCDVAAWNDVLYDDLSVFLY